MNKKRNVISQREAHRLRKRVAEMEQFLLGLRRSWQREWPGPMIWLGRVPVDPQMKAVVDTAKALRHAVVVTVDASRNELILWADPVSAPK